MVLQSEELAASASTRAVLDGLARHGREIAQEVATGSPGRPSFLPTRDTYRSNRRAASDLRQSAAGNVRGERSALSGRRAFLARARARELALSRRDTSRAMTYCGSSSNR